MMIPHPVLMPPMLQDALQAIERFIARQRAAWPCWLAVAMGAGIAIYFGLDSEPALWPGPLVAALAAVSILFLKRWPLTVVALAGILSAAAGFSVAAFRTDHVAAPQLNRSIYRAEVTGRVVEIELYPGSLRVTLDRLSISSPKTGKLAADSLPQRVRIRLARVVDEITIGDWLKVTADLQPPQPPVIPGGFDFRRQAYFERLGGVGFSLLAPEKLPRPLDEALHPVDDLMSWCDTLRLRIGLRIRDILPGATGAMAMALVVGNQRALRADDVQAMQDSGLAHLTSISGLHIGLAAGIVFFSVRALLALLPWVALRFDIKKWSAVCALLGAVFYSGLAGMPVPTQRSLVMTAVFFGAILADRSPISMRVVAVAAIAVLVAAPESLVGASFQMSFAAVLGLICVFDAGRKQFLDLRRAGRQAPDLIGRVIGALGRGLVALGTLALTSLVASLMTAPFAAYHFNRLTLYGIAANMLAVPLTGFFIMPCAVLSLVAMPFGLDAWPLRALGWGCDLVLWTAHTVSGWPAAVILLPAMPLAGLLAISLGLIWLCLITGRWRLAGVVPVLIGCLSPLTARAPEVLAAGDGKLVAVMDGAGHYRFSSGRGGKIAAETWLRRNAQAERLPFPTGPVAVPPSADGGDACNADWCLFATGAGPLGVALADTGIGPACRSADWVISLEPAGTGCPGDAHKAKLLIDFFDLWRHGTHAFSITDEGAIRVERAWDVGDRPWAMQRFPDPARAGVSTGASAQ